MIPLNIDDPVVLRRTLEEIEAQLIITQRPITPVDLLLPDADLLTTVAKLNQVIEGFNAVVTELGLSETSALK